jgi:hypothetical protein
MTDHIVDATEKVDLDALEKLADEATPGPWAVREGTYAVHQPEYECWIPADRLDAAFIAAANPVAIKALIAELKEARGIIAETVEEFGCTIDLYNRIGPHWTSADGEMFDVGVVLDREPLIDRGRAFLARNGKATKSATKAES